MTRGVLMSYLNVHYECIQNKQNMTISRWSCPFYLTPTAWRGDGMDEVNLLLPVASPSPPRVLQFALFTLFGPAAWLWHAPCLQDQLSWCSSIQASGSVCFPGLLPVMELPQRCFYLKHLFCCLPNFLALNTSPAAEQSGAG